MPSSHMNSTSTLLAQTVAILLVTLELAVLPEHKVFVVDRVVQASCAAQ